MIERLWRHDALRVQLQSRIGVVVASAVLLVAGQPATAQESIDFEDPPYTGSAAGTVITGQDGFYIPVPDSQDGLVYTYAGNALGLPGNPTAGGNLQFAGVTGGDPALPVPFARAQRDVVYGNGTGVWTVSFDIAATYLGDLPSAQNIGSFSTQLFDTEATFIALATWTDPDTAATWNADYVWFNASGVQLTESVDDPGFQTLLIDHWYRWCTTFNLNTNQIVEVSITDLTTGTTVTNHPVGRYLVGGGAGGFDPPSGFRLFGGSATAAGNTLGFDNVDIELRPDPPAGGACCFFDDQTCEFLTQEVCEAGGGSYLGDWTGCTDQGCLEIPDACNEDAGSCNDPDNGTPGCNIELCCALICAIPGFDTCCKFEWDQFCADEAALHFECFEPDVPEGFYLNAAEFQAALLKAGKVKKGTEDFSENILGPGAVDGIDDPLDTDSSDAESFPDGILIDNLTFQANIGGIDSSVPAPHTPNTPGEPGLALGTTGFQNATSDAVLANFFVDAYDILSGPPAGDNHTAIAMTLVTILGSETVRVEVYDKEENLLGSGEVPAPVNGGQFLGLIFAKGVTIGRVNIWDPMDGAEGVYDVTVYVLDDGEPCPWDLDDNNSVGATDLLSLLVNWGPYEPCPPFKPMDFDENCSVGATDLLALLVNWGPCP